MYEKLIKYKNVKKKKKKKKKPPPFVALTSSSYLPWLSICSVISLLPYFKGWEQNMGLKWLVLCKLQTLIDIEYPCFLLYPF